MHFPAPGDEPHIEARPEEELRKRLPAVGWAIAVVVATVGWIYFIYLLGWHLVTRLAQ
jgi:hypothetical protein